MKCNMLLQAYMWCDGPGVPQVLPAVLAKPWATVAAALDMPPVLVYATYNLLNWRLIADPLPAADLAASQRPTGAAPGVAEATAAAAAVRGGGGGSGMSLQQSAVAAAGVAAVGPAGAGGNGGGMSQQEAAAAGVQVGERTPLGVELGNLVCLHVSMRLQRKPTTNHFAEDSLYSVFPAVLCDSLRCRAYGTFCDGIS